MSQLEFTTGYAILGVDLVDDEALRLHDVTLGIQHLYGWSAISGFTKGQATLSGDSEVSYRSPKAQSFRVNDDISVELTGVQIITPACARERISR